MTTLPLGAADAAALAGIACLVCWPLLKSRMAILAAQFAVGAFFAVHYGLLGLGAAAAISVLGGAQSLAAMAAPRWPLLDRVGYALIPAIAGSALWFWAGPTTLLAALAMSLIALGRMSRDDRRLRLLILSGCTVWGLHDAAVGAWLMFAGDVLSFATGAWALLSPRIGAWIRAPRTA